MANSKPTGSDDQRLYVRVTIPHIDLAQVAVIVQSIRNIVKEVPGAEVETTLTEPLPGT
jgi:hypothetical protein